MSHLWITAIVIASIMVGGYWGGGAASLEPVAQLILGTFKFIVVPLVFSSIVLSVLRINETLKRIVYWALTLFLLLTVSAIVLALVISSLLPYPSQFSHAATIIVAPLTLQSWASTLLPTNVVAALSGSSLTQVTIVSILVALGLRKSRHRDYFISLFEGINDMATVWMGWVNRGLPILISVLIIWGVGTNWAKLGTSSVIMLMGIFIAALIHNLITYSVLIGLTNPRQLLAFWQHIWPVGATAFATTSAGATLPVTVDAMRRMGISEYVIQFIAPTGSIVNKGGTAIFHIVGIWTTCLIWGIPLTPLFIINIFFVVLITSFATGNIPGAGLVGFSMIAPVLGLPIASVAMIAAIDRLCDMMRTPTNVIGDCAAALAVQGIMNRNISSITRDGGGI